MVHYHSGSRLNVAVKGMHMVSNNAYVVCGILAIIVWY